MENSINFFFFETVPKGVGPGAQSFVQKVQAQSLTKHTWRWAFHYSFYLTIILYIVKCAKSSSLEHTFIFGLYVLSFSLYLGVFLE